MKSIKLSCLHNVAKAIKTLLIGFEITANSFFVKTNKIINFFQKIADTNKNIVKLRFTKNPRVSQAIFQNTPLDAILKQL